MESTSTTIMPPGAIRQKIDRLFDSGVSMPDILERLWFEVDAPIPTLGRLKDMGQTAIENLNKEMAPEAWDIFRGLFPSQSTH